MKTFVQTVIETEKRYLKNLLTQTKGDVTSAAKAACMTVPTIYRRISSHDIKIPNRYARKRQVKLPSRKIHIQTLLPFFGVPCDSTRHGGAGFWERYAGSLDAMFFDARKNYMAMVRKYHESGTFPDAERMAHINALWQQLEGSMRKHGVEC